jgi:hypothetical protein
MTYPREPRLHPVPIAELRPTQMTVGMREVEAKRASWRHHPDRDKPDFLGRHMIPVVEGPKHRHYIIDHHHLSLALHLEGVTDVLVSVVADLSRLKGAAFWTFMDNRSWMHPYDVKGRRRPYEDLPRSVKGLDDDPYRSLAGELRRIGGFAKDTTPFSEFLWADYLRRKIKIEHIGEDFDKALKRAYALARHADADFLPGWCGPQL